MTPLESILIVLGCISVIKAQTITTPPQHSSATVGNNVTLTCGLSSTPSGMQWRKYNATLSGGYRICEIYPPNPATCDSPEMYYLDSVTYSLTITSLAFTNGPEYGCKVDDNGVAETASVLVAAVPTISVPAIVEVDKNASFSCNTVFSSKPYDELIVNQQPTLALYFAGSVVAQTKGYVNDGVSQTHTMELTYNRLITVADIGAEILCTISTVTSSYSETSSVIVDVHYSVTVVGLNDAEVKSYYAVDENVTCTADGFPEPTYTWVDLNDTSRTLSGQVLTFDTFTLGQVYFMVCRAGNTYNSAPLESPVLGPFSVGVDPDGPGEISQAGSNAWIAAAVLVPVAVIVAVVVLVIFLRKRKQKPPPPKAQNTLQPRPPTVSAYNNNNTNFSGVNSNPAGSLPPVYSYQGPYSAGQTPRASPGYGDLGVRQFTGMVGMTAQPQGRQQALNTSNSFNDAGSIRSDSYAHALPASSRPPPPGGISNPAANISRASSASSHSQNPAFSYQPTPYQPTPYSRPSPSNQPRGVVTRSLDDSLV